MLNKTYYHPGQRQMQVEVILASIAKESKNHKPIYTIRMRYPRPIHGEIMTHRVFGRNARSSRAVPVKTMLYEVRSIPYVPWHWGKNQKGMQADSECNEKVAVPLADNDGVYTLYNLSREEAWLELRDRSADIAEAFMEAGYHKQNPNRLLEPFSWIDTLITSTEWSNFLWLRDHHMAEPHLQDLARLVDTAIKKANVEELDYDSWHQPYITTTDYWYADNLKNSGSIDSIDDYLNKISAARCARISYKPFDGDGSYESEIKRYDMLVTSDRVHASPLEHQAKPDHAHMKAQDKDMIFWRNPKLHGNLTGYIQARKLVPNEAKMD